MAGVGAPTSPNVGTVAAVAAAAAAAAAASAPTAGVGSLGNKKSWWRRLAPCLAFLAAFSTAMALLLVWSEAAALRRQAFDANMTRDYVLHSVSMDDPQLIAYIRQVQLVPTTRQDPPNANQTTEDNYVAGLFQGKRDGVYLEYISRAGASSTTSWLESTYGWRGVLVLTDFRSFFEARKSSRHRKTRVLHACLSKDTKEITYHQESEVQVTKLGEGPNSLVSSDDGLPTMRLKCFPLYSVLLAYNATNLDYLSLDSSDAPDGQGQGRKSDASHALGVFRGDVYDPNDELSNMQMEAETNASRKSSVFDLIKTPANRKAVLASFGMMAFQQLSGVNAVIFYTVTIFEAAGSDMNPDLAAIIVALVQAVMAGVAALIVDRAGRKPLLIFSSLAMALSLIALGVYFKIQANGSDVSNLGWLPLSSLVIFMIAFSIGLGPIPWMLMGELFTIETKAVASSLAVMLNWFLVFLVTKTFPAMKEGLGSATTFWIFAVIMAIATVFTIFAVPETKGKTLQEIQAELSGLSRISDRNI